MALLAGTACLFWATPSESASVISGSVERIEVREIKFNPPSGQVTLRWNSEVGKLYAIEESTNSGTGWVQSTTDVPGARDETSMTFLPHPTHAAARAMLFRVREVGSAVVEDEATEPEENLVKEGAGDNRGSWHRLIANAVSRARSASQQIAEFEAKPAPPQFVAVQSHEPDV